MKLPIRHLSVRVPWHDNYWNGSICKDPRNNASCMFLPRIQTKDVDFEEANHSLPFNEIKERDKEKKLKIPPCIGEKVTFMSDFDVIKKVTHPYSSFEPNYKHYKETNLKYPKKSLSVIPYRWMLKNKETKESEIAKKYEINYNIELEPKLKFVDQWVQNYDNQKTLLDTFISAVKPESSLVFIYAKNIPLIDYIDRILIGVGKVTSIGNLTEYDYTVKNPPFRSLLWERPIFHSIKSQQKNGFLLPYQDLIKLNEKSPIDNIDNYIAYCPNFDQFSYGSELVSHDSAIDALVNLREALYNCGKLLENDYSNQLEWIDSELSKIWNMRGAYPGIGSVLSAMKVPEGNIVAWEIEKYIQEKNKGLLKTNPWDVIEEIFNGKADWLNSNLKKNIGKTFKGVWEKIPEIKKQFLVLLSRMEINNNQAEQLYKEKEVKHYLENPFLFYEKTVLTADPITFNTVDKAFFPEDNIQKAFPLKTPSLIEEPLDKRRIRSLVIETLENASLQGHSILTQSQIITEINNRKLEKPCNVSTDILEYIEEYFSNGTENEVIKIFINKDEITKEETKFYKLHRLFELKEEISNEILGRIKSGKKIKIDIDWKKIVKEKFKIDIKKPKCFQEKQSKANAEKAAALKELAESKFSILIGPAGTGKTTLLEILCSVPEIKNKKVLLLAPTGKARVKLGPKALTIAQFLASFDRYDGETNRYYINNEAQNYSEARTVIIDEASMLTEDQLGAVINTIIDVDRLILVGDSRQLPPIGTGKPFVDIIQFLKPTRVTKNKPIVCDGFAELIEIFRQEEFNNENCEERIDVQLTKWFSNSEIRKSEDIFDEISMHPTKEWDSLKLIGWYNVKDLEGKILEELKNHLQLENTSDQLNFDLKLGGIELKNKTLLPAYFNIESAASAEDWQILSPVNANGFGTKELNRLVQKTFRKNNIELAEDPPSLWYEDFYPKRIPVPIGDDNMVYGDKVINLRNTRWDKPWNRIVPYDLKEHSLQYFANGEIGLINGEQRGDAFFRNYSERVRKWKANGGIGKKPSLDDPLINITFTSQPEYSYQFKPGNFANGNDNNKNKVIFELAYAITVHKSQGSGFETVFLILPNPCIILSRELLYTALTRQKKKIVILHQGDFKDFKKYIGDAWSETGKRLTDLFGLPNLRVVNEKHYDAKYVQISAKGEFMISKSEVIIADHLFYNKIKYTYENAITDDRGITIHPDFTIKDKSSGNTYYWEHLGLLNDDSYRKKWERKMDWYKYNNIVLVNEAKQEDDKRLIVSKDKPDGGIDSQEVLLIIEKVIKNK